MKRLVFIAIFLLITSLPPAAHASPSPGSYVTLREYVELLVAERGKYWEARFQASQIAVDLARVNLEKELEKLNELRQSVVKDRGEFLLRESADSKFISIDRQLAEVKDRQTTMETRSATWMIAIGLLFVFVQTFLSWRKTKKKEAL